MDDISSFVESAFGTFPLALAVILVIALIVLEVLLVAAPIATMFYARKMNQRLQSIQSSLANIARRIQNQ